MSCYWIIYLLQLLIPLSIAIDSNCDFYQEVPLGQTFYIYNKQYPGNYSSNTACRWYAVSPLESTIILSCDPINIPLSDGCSTDRLSVSTTGNTNFDDAHNYCGKGSLTLESKQNTLAVGLFSNQWTVGGNFICTVKSVSKNDSTQCMCGWKQGSRIVGGTETGINEFPSMVGIIQVDDSQYVYCGGTIIASRYVLSAGHCFFQKNIARMAILVGDHNIDLGNETRETTLHKIEYAIVHPNFNEKTLANDIAIVRTIDVIIFSDLVGPVCLPFQYTMNNFEGQSVTALGWGNIQFTDAPSKVLLKVNLTIVNTEDCASKIADRPVTQNQICSYGVNKDTCSRDSGGPLLWMAPDKRLEVVGLISYGIYCATEIPSVNTRVTSYLSWIVSQTKDATYCP